MWGRIAQHYNVSVFIQGRLSLHTLVYCSVSFFMITLHCFNSWIFSESNGSPTPRLWVRFRERKNRQKYVHTVSVVFGWKCLPNVNRFNTFYVFRGAVLELFCHFVFRDKSIGLCLCSPKVWDRCQFLLHWHLRLILKTGVSELDRRDANPVLYCQCCWSHIRLIHILKCASLRRSVNVWTEMQSLVLHMFIKSIM